MPKSHLQGAFFVFFFLNLDSGIFAEDAPGSSVDEASWVLDCERNLVVNAPNSKKIIFGDAGKLAFNPTSGDIVSDQMARLEAALVDMEALKGAVEGVNLENADLKQELAALKQDVAAMKPDLDAVKTDVADLKPDVSTVKTDVASMKPDLSTLKVDVAAVRDNVDVARTNITSLQDDVAKLKPDVVGVRNDVGTVTAKNAAVTADVAGLKTDKAGLRTDLDALAGTVATLTGGVKNLTAAAAEAEEAQINVTNALSNVVYGDEFHPGGNLDFTEGSISLAILKESLPGVKMFIQPVYLKGFNVKASVLNALVKDVVTIGGVLKGYSGFISFDANDGDLEFASLKYVERLTFKDNDARVQELEFIPEEPEIEKNPRLKSISMPKLKYVLGNAIFYNNILLTELDLQSLVIVGGYLYIHQNPRLATDGVQVSKDFSKCGSYFRAGYNGNALTGLKCTGDNGLKAVVAAATFTPTQNPPSCRK